VTLMLRAAVPPTWAATVVGGVNYRKGVMDNRDKTTTETGSNLLHLNGEMVNEILKKRCPKESFNLMAHLANGASVRDLPRAVDKTGLNGDDKFIVAALVAAANAFCYDIAATPEAEAILGGCDGWTLLNDALGAVEEKPETKEGEKEDVSD